jgi:hypothetical protein
MSELVRATVKDTFELLSGLIASPEAVDKFADWFMKIGERQFVMTVHDGEYRNKPNELAQFGTVVTITTHDGEGKFELLQGFLPVAEEMYLQTGRRFFTDFFEAEFGSVIQIPDKD